MKTNYLDDRYVSNATPCRQNFVKLTKSMLNEFIGWTTSRYNNYLGFGTKKENVDLIFNSLTIGHFLWINSFGSKARTERIGEIIFVRECASPVGESGTNKRGSYWRTKQGGDVYIVDCNNKTVYACYSKRVIKFL